MSRRCLFLLLPLASTLVLLRPTVHPRATLALQQYDAYGQQHDGQVWAQQPMQQQMGLPAGWTSVVDAASGVVYYCFGQTGQCQWELPTAAQGHAQQYGSPGSQEVIAHISQRLREPQVRIVSAVVDLLGDTIALDLLAHTEQIQAQGGMIVPETGKPRTSGGVYFKLLKDAQHLPRQAQEAALHRIKIEGKKVKSWEKATVPEGSDWW